jgi:hypothetical protein
MWFLVCVCVCVCVCTPPALFDLVIFVMESQDDPPIYTSHVAGMTDVPPYLVIG